MESLLMTSSEFLDIFYPRETCIFATTDGFVIVARFLCSILTDMTQNSKKQY